MLSVAEAQSEILRRACALRAQPQPLTENLLGCVLAEDVTSDQDSPPYDKAMMDGYAVRAADIGGPLVVIEEITAGRVPQRAVAAGQSARIMTGAPLPSGADTVVPVERSRLLDDGCVVLEASMVKPGANILRRAREMKQGETILSAGTVLRPAEFGLLALVGKTQVRVVPRPTVAILCTGDEIVEPSAVPGPGQIRNSNGPMLVAQVARSGGIPRFLGIGRDERENLAKLIADGLRDPMLVLSGGVSAGKLDLVPGVLQEMGVTPHFHKIEMKPGKPLFFGTRPRDGGQTLVFGLPGNPVSSLACFELFVRPAIRALRGLSDPGPRMVPAKLTEDFPYRTERPTYHPAWLTVTEQGFRVAIVPWFGSPDLRGMTKANALALLPSGDHVHRAGEVLSVVCMEEING